MRLIITVVENVHLKTDPAGSFTASITDSTQPRFYENPGMKN